MDVHESIEEMFTRFINIINSLKKLGKIYSASENVSKILRSLPKNWETKVTHIQNAKDLTKLTLEELIGSLVTHEIIMKEHMKKESNKKKSIVSKTILEVDSEDILDEEDVAYLTLKYKNFVERKKQLKRHIFSQRESVKM